MGGHLNALDAGELTAFERRVLDACLDAPHPDLEALRCQAKSVRAGTRTHTGVGAYLDFVVAEDAPRACKPVMMIGDVNVTVRNVPLGVATILYVVDGVLDFIEFATYDGEWPHEPELLDIGYLKEIEVGNDAWSLLPTSERDPATLARALATRTPAES